MDYSTYLNGIAKEELDSLDRLAGHFEIETCEIVFSGEKEPDGWMIDWEKTREYLKENLADDTAGGTDGTLEFSIFEKAENRKRYWFISDVDGCKKELHLQSDTACWSWEETNCQNNQWAIQQQDFIEDGKLAHVTKIARKNSQGELKLHLDLYVSFTAGKGGNIIRKSVHSLPNRNIKITMVMWARRVHDEQTK